MSANSKTSSRNRRPPRPAALGRLAAWSRPLESRTAFLQRQQDRVRTGYVHWVGGEIAPERWPGLARKFDALYRVRNTAKQRARAKARGEASAMLISYHDLIREHDEHGDEVAVHGVVRWVLQVTTGTHPAHVIERSNMKNALTREGRIVLPALGYCLLRIDAKWTWKMTAEHFAMWEERIRRAASHPNPDEASLLARQIVWSLSHVPGFRGIRHDAFTLRGKLLEEWRRLRSANDLRLLPQRPWPRIGFARRVKSL